MIASTRVSIANSLKGRMFYGWVIVAIGFLGMLASGAGQSHTFSVFYTVIADDLGISRTDVTWAYGGATVAAAFILPSLGRVVDRVGPRMGLIYFVCGLGLACMLFGAAANMLWLTVGFTLLRVLGQGAMALGTSNMVAKWFLTRRGLAMSLATLGFGFSMAVHPKLGQVLIDAYDWRTAWVLIGLATWGIMLPPLLLLAYDRPSALGLTQDNTAPTEGETAPEQAGATLAQALRHPSFYLLGLCVIGSAGLVTALHYHHVAILMSQGISAAWATNSFVITSVSMMVLMPLTGRAWDRWRTRYVLALGLCVLSAALVMITQVQTTLMVVVNAILFGFTNTFSITGPAYLWARYFGTKNLGQIQGTGQMVALIGASLGPLPVSLAFDASGDPTNTLLMLAIYPVAVAALSVLFLRTHPAVEGTQHLE